ncbi:formyltransferase family protein [Butyrivibrio sp. XBB1001]|uniref:formyltransferase family protein n=1 Tax=Butyrivibrio sp. XBB1001 TaxID=1280682 RepID=UPI0003FA44E4|nr:formyltransferase family protein [Butyrivibrio sp. XBB1001]
MKILCLYNNDCAIELFDYIRNLGHETVLWSEKLTEEFVKEQVFDLAVSYTYRYILPENIILALKENVVNIHNSFLPFNRGADPNMWSIVDNTPRGTTLHYINTGLDKGSIIAQEMISDLSDEETLASTYNNLDKAAKDLFKKAFEYYDKWPSMRKMPEGKGSYHSVKDGTRIKELIPSFDITIAEFRNLLREQA